MKKVGNIMLLVLVLLIIAGGLWIFIIPNNSSIITAKEICNSIDDDKDGLTDEGLACPTFSDNKVISGHPRMFFTQSELDRIKVEIQSEPKKTAFQTLKESVDSDTNNPTGTTNENRGYQCNGVLTGNKCSGNWYLATIQKPRDWCISANRAALVYKLTGNDTYLQKTIKMLNVSLNSYKQDFDLGVSFSWYSIERVECLSAYDLIYNEMPSDFRRSFLIDFYDIFDKYWNAYHTSPSRNFYYYGGSTAAEHTGFYSENNLWWYMGLAGVKDGIADSRATAYLQKGYNVTRLVMEQRENTAKDDGCFSSQAINYMWGAYPWATYNFLYTWKSATGEDISNDITHLGQMSTCIFWNWIPNNPMPFEFGLGDTYHNTNNLPISHTYTHMNIINDIYKNTKPEFAKTANYIKSIMPAGYSYWAKEYLFIRLKLNQNNITEKVAITSNARYFEGIGLITMRSGSTTDDTYIAFSTSPSNQHHRHLDVNNFVIYKKGFLIEDTGSRAKETDCNLQYYYQMTVAHNTLLVYMPNESRPVESNWGIPDDASKCKIIPQSKYLYGGQYKTTNSKLLAFETNNKFTYIASDATNAYRAAKVKQFVREFVFLYPNYVVMYDRTESTKPEYNKELLFHTQNRPEEVGDTYRISENNGVLFLRTLYPTNANKSLIGGAGQEFVSGGVNWELDPTVYSTYKYLGNWRIVVAPKTPQTKDNFLHFIEIGDKSLTQITSNVLIDTPDKTGVQFFTKDGKKIIVTFNKANVGGEIEINGIKQTFTSSIQKQSGLNG